MVVDDVPLTTYTVRSYDAKGHGVGEAATVPASATRTCAPLQLATRGDHYTVVRIDAVRGRGTGTTYVHIAAEPQAGAPRVIGIWRP